MTNMVNVTPKNPLAGAAFQILYEAWHPHFVSSREQQAAIQNEFDKVSAWASFQPPHIKRAYDWAIKELERQMELSMQARELGLQVHAHLQSIPRPPNAIRQPAVQIEQVGLTAPKGQQKEESAGP